MSQIKEMFLPLAQAALKAAKDCGAQEAQVDINRQEFAECAFRDGEMERAAASTKLGLSLRLYLDGRFAMHQTSDLRPDALEDFVRQAARLTRQLEPDHMRTLPEPEAMARPGEYDLGIYDPEFEGKQAEHWIGLASQVEKELAARGIQAKAKYVSSQGAAYGETAWELFADSRGFVGELKETAGYVGGSLVLLDDHDESKRRMGYWAELGRELSGLGGQEQIQKLAGHAQQRAEWQMGARPGPTGDYPIVVENRVAGKLANQWLGCINGQAVHQKRSYLADSLGGSVAAEILNLVDQPGLKGGLGSRWYDSEGMAANDLSIITGGVLDNYYLSTYYARKLGMAPTTGGSSNLVFKASVPTDAQALCRDMPEGLLITGFLGGNFNSTTGDFSYGVSGRWIKDGKPAYAVEGMNLSGNAKTFWHGLSAVGNDPYEMARVRTPSLAFDKASLSGD